MDITKIIGIIAVYGALLITSNMLAMMLMMMLIIIKQKTSKMAKEEFEKYFKSLDEKIILKFLFVVYIGALVIVALLGYKLFQFFELGSPLILAIGFVIVGVIKTIYKMFKNRVELIDALREFGKNK